MLTPNQNEILAILNSIHAQAMTLKDLCAAKAVQLDSINAGTSAAFIRELGMSIEECIPNLTLDAMIYQEALGVV